MYWGNKGWMLPDVAVLNLQGFLKVLGLSLEHKASPSHQLHSVWHLASAISLLSPGGCCWVQGWSCSGSYMEI